MPSKLIILIVIIVMASSSDGAGLDKFRTVPRSDDQDRMLQENPRNDTGRGFFLRGKFY